MDSTQLHATAIGPQSPEPFQHVCFEGDEPNVFSWGLFWLPEDVQSEFLLAASFRHFICFSWQP